MSTDQSQVDQSVPALLAALRDPDAMVRQRAAQALGESGDARAIKPLQTILKDDPKAEVRAAAVNALGKLAPLNDSIMAQLMIALHDEQVDVRGAAASAVPVAITKLAVAVTNDDADVESNVILTIGEIIDAVNSIAEHNSIPEVRAYLAHDAGIRLVQLGLWYDGLHLLEESLTIRRDGDDLNAHADTLYQIAHTHHLMGNFDKSRTYYRDALRLYERTDNQRGIADCKSGLGHLMTQIGLVDDAIVELQSAQRIYRKLGDKKQIGIVEEILQLAKRVREKQLA